MKKLAILFLALILCIAMPISAAADAIIYDPSKVNENLIECPINEGDCKAINVFLSNLVEANVVKYEYNNIEYKQVAIAGTLKHFELNGPLYAQVSSSKDPEGRTYMAIGADTFEKKLKQIFNTVIKASDCPGYKDGKIYVTAENFAAPINVFASVHLIQPIDDGTYKAFFYVYKASSELTNRYSTPHYLLPTENLERIAQGNCIFRFNGSLSQTSFSTSDFSVMRFNLSNYDSADFLYTNANEPYGSDSADISSNPDNTVSSNPASDILSEKDDVMDEDGDSASMDFIMLIIIGVGIVVLALIVLVIVLTFFRKK